MSTTTHQPTEAPVPEHLREHLIAAASRYLGLQLRASGEAFDEEPVDAPSLGRVDAAREAYATLREGGTSIAADVMVAVAEEARYWIATPLGEGHGPTGPRERARAHRDVADLELLAAGLPLEEDANSAGHPSSLTADRARAGDTTLVVPAEIRLRLVEQMLCEIEDAAEALGHAAVREPAQLDQHADDLARAVAVYRALRTPARCFAASDVAFAAAALTRTLIHRLTEGDPTLDAVEAMLRRARAAERLRDEALELVERAGAER
ncbi:hypothetical protein GKE82_03680 [Conexibacter sp. W3-3-2]|uniref:hypothetical protein n=1 Tax=Conexibacter sp. W3-3-2 TaxID=2675227 RepID=UPI0012B96241|nr:hypothetical protein [Conexibacter sp. W3-3-2]MTD43425.1 hypothetical protein [Conexibacter sp. W3-3-2]